MRRLSEGFTLRRGQEKASPPVLGLLESSGFVSTREHRQLELETFLQLPGTEPLWSRGRFHEWGPDGGPEGGSAAFHVISICSEGKASSSCAALPRTSRVVTHVHPVGLPKTRSGPADLRLHTKWGNATKKNPKIKHKKLRTGRKTPKFEGKPRRLIVGPCGCGGPRRPSKPIS